MFEAALAIGTSCGMIVATGLKAMESTGTSCAGIVSIFPVVDEVSISRGTS